MDKIGEANKPFEACVEDMMEDERNKKQETVVDTFLIVNEVPYNPVHPV